MFFVWIRGIRRRDVFVRVLFYVNCVSCFHAVVIMRVCIIPSAGVRMRAVCLCWYSYACCVDMKRSCLPNDRDDTRADR